MSFLQVLSWDPNRIPDSPLCEVIPSLSKPTTPSMCLLTGIGSKLLSAATVTCATTTSAAAGQSSAQYASADGIFSAIVDTTIAVSTLMLIALGDKPPRRNRASNTSAITKSTGALIAGGNAAQSAKSHVASVMPDRSGYGRRAISRDRIFRTFGDAINLLGCPRAQSNARRHISVRSAREIFGD